MAYDIVYSTHPLQEDVRRYLEHFCSITEWEGPSPIPHVTLRSEISEASGLLVTSADSIDREILAAAPLLRVISTMSAETCHIDLATTTARGITVCYTPEAANEAIADMTMTLLLACARKVIDADRFIKNGQWLYPSIDLFPGIDMQDSTVGIIGLGRVGLQVAHRAQGFGMRILYFDQRRNEDAEQRMSLQFGSLDNVLREADFVTVHLARHPSTYHLINAARLRLMKRNAYLINMSNASIVDHDALVTALREGWISGAGIDVYDSEPIRQDDELLSLPNVILTPHLGPNTYDGTATMMWMAAEQIVDVLHGKLPAHPVNPRRKAA